MPLAVAPGAHVVAALTIAGSDSGGGAGIQTDLKTFHALGVHGCSAITAMTAQNLRGVTDVQASTPEFLDAQMDAVLSEFDIRAIKIGMLANASLARTVTAKLREYPSIPVVLDPVMVATSGSTLLESDAIAVLREELFPLASVLTPNIPEAELILGRRIENVSAMFNACNDVLAMGPRSILLKGAHLSDSDEVTDFFLSGDASSEVTHPRLPFEAHGTGCTLSSAIAARIVQGDSLQDACMNGIDFVQKALKTSYHLSESPVRVLNVGA